MTESFFSRPILSPQQARAHAPLSLESAYHIEDFQKTIQDILHGRDKRLLLIVGPCALQSQPAVLEYAERLHALQKYVGDSFFIIMRAYFEKARSSNGWKGSMYSQSAHESPIDLEASIIQTRTLLTQLASLPLPLAAEFIDPLAYPFFADCISWASIGARTIYSQPHRILASHFSMPCGMKNSVEGSIEAACLAIRVANQPHQFLAIDDSGRLCSCSSHGNPYAHLVLRGGHARPNYMAEDIIQATHMLQSMNLLESIVIDCSHGNSGKDHKLQPNVFQHIITNICSHKTPAVKGIMLESFLQGGSITDMVTHNLQDHEKRAYIERVSHVDPCLDWETTESIILQGHHQLTGSHKNFSYHRLRSFTETREFSSLSHCEHAQKNHEYL